MRNEFPGYFDPSNVDVASLWKDAVIALDTNVLLGLYRMPTSTREEIFNLLTLVGARLWVPYHVLVEYYRNRLEVMRSEFKAAKQLERDFKVAYDGFKAVVANDGVKDRACWPDLSKKLDELGETVQELLDVARAESNNYISPNSQDSVLTFLEALLPGKCGQRPVDQASVDAAEEEAERRFSIKVGPGYLDRDKAGDRYMFDGLVYDRQYGDFMVWKELLDHCRESNIRKVLLITSDVKQDWWLDSKSISGKRPQPELVMEMRRRGEVESFWMYTLSEFLSKSAVHLQTKVTRQAITDVRQAETNSARDTRSKKVTELTKPVGDVDLRRVLKDLGAEETACSAQMAFGFLKRPDGNRDAIIVMPGDEVTMWSPSVKNHLRRAIDTLGLFYEMDCYQLYALFPSAPSGQMLKWAAMAGDEALTGVIPKGSRSVIHAGYFLNNERTEHMFMSFDGDA